MKKNDRISAFIDTLDSAPEAGLDPCYTGFFTCFNRGEYYEAHDVLEHLWLQTRDANHAFYKGLIQFAGAFVHLRKQFLRPDHPKDGRRLRPAVRLFQLSWENVAPFAPLHLRLNVAAIGELGKQHVEAIVASEFTMNPWNSAHLPQLALLPMAS